MKKVPKKQLGQLLSALRKDDERIAMSPEEEELVNKYKWTDEGLLFSTRRHIGKLIDKADLSGGTLSEAVLSALMAYFGFRAFQSTVPKTFDQFLQGAGGAALGVISLREVLHGETEAGVLAGWLGLSSIGIADEFGGDIRGGINDLHALAVTIGNFLSKFGGGLLHPDLAIPQPVDQTPTQRSGNSQAPNLQPELLRLTISNNGIIPYAGDAILTINADNIPNPVFIDVFTATENQLVSRVGFVSGKFAKVGSIMVSSLSPVTFKMKLEAFGRWVFYCTDPVLGAVSNPVTAKVIWL